MKSEREEVGAESISDIELVRRTLSGDRQAYQVLVEKYQQRVYAVAFGVVHNREDALDVVQDVMIKAYRKLARFRGASSYYTWLYRITVNMAIDYRRKRKNTVQVEYDDRIGAEDEPDRPGLKSQTEDPSEALDRKEINDLVMGAMKSLPEEQRTVLVLREIEGLSYDEIAKVAGISIGTVMSRLHYGRKKLRDVLAPHVSGRIR
jgi:RNA polymerase sigma-70 factor (ECF subfamily)